MGSITDYLEDELLDHVLNGNTFSPAATLYLCLCTADPTDAATGASMSECGDSGAYERTEITFDEVFNRQIYQLADVTFPTATGSWGTVTHFAIADTQTHGAGNVYAHGTLAFSRSVESGNTPVIAAAEIMVELLTEDISSYLANALLDFAFRDQVYASPPTWVALCDGLIEDAATGDTMPETSGSGYARVRVYTSGCGAPEIRWSAVASGRVENDAAIVFPTALADWGDMTGIAVVDADSLGNMLFYDNDMTDQAV